MILEPVFTFSARSDVAGAANFYAEISTDLKNGFGARLRERLNQVAAHPKSCRIYRKGVRRANLRQFPFFVLYVVREETLWVLAVAHEARNPQEIFRHLS